MRTHLFWPALDRTACGRDTGVRSVYESAVTCAHCLNEAAIRAAKVDAIMKRITDWGPKRERASDARTGGFTMLSPNRMAQGTCPDPIHFEHSDECRELREEHDDNRCRCGPCPECGVDAFDPLNDDAERIEWERRSRGACS